MAHGIAHGIAHARMRVDTSLHEILSHGACAHEIPTHGACDRNAWRMAWRMASRMAWRIYARMRVDTSLHETLEVDLACRQRRVGRQRPSKLASHIAQGQGLGVTHNRLHRETPLAERR
jgi:hypothetical protein